MTVSFSPEEADSDLLTIEDVQTFTPEMQQMLNSPNGLAQLVVNPFDEFWQTALRTVASELQAFLASNGAERIALAADAADGSREDASLSVLDLPLLRKTQSLLAEFSPARYPEMLERVRAVKAELAKRYAPPTDHDEIFVSVTILSKGTARISV